MSGSSLRSQVVVVGVSGVVGIFVWAAMLRPWLQPGSWQPFIAGGVFLTMMGIVLAFVGQSHPFPRLGPANQLTMLRAMLVAIVASLAAESASHITAWTIVSAAAVVAALDGADGWWARRSGMASAFGARFDMEIDAFLILVLSIFVWTYDKAGMWVVACGLIRYAFVATGWARPWMAGRLTPTLRGKAVAAVQFVGLSLALAPVVPRPQSAYVAAVTLAALAWSFAIDIGRLWRQRDAAG